jgi:ribosomal protein S18 acetylase RimI-like enzyme
MSQIIEAASVHSVLSTQNSAVPLPAPRVGISVRVGEMRDVPFVDRLMKKNSKALAFLPTEALEGKVRLKHVLIAETSNGERAGYLIGNDRYKSRDELGVIYQICVEPKFRRMLVGAHLLKARFETSAYGCKLYCCWCAQDLTESNRFYESMGFVPLAFRAGSEKRSRLHIFWQKRIREGDTTTDWWFPSETSGGLMDAARIALPIPPGLKWSDELPRIVPEESAMVEEEERPVKRSPKRATPEPERSAGGFYFGKRSSAVAEKPAKPKKVKKNNPELAAKARELRDRYMEQFNANPPQLTTGKYDVARLVDTSVTIEMSPQKLIAA